MASPLAGLRPLEIAPPPPPPWWQELTIPVLVLLALWLLLAWWRHPPNRRRRRLSRLRRVLATPGGDTRGAAAELDQLLREHLAQPRLDPAVVPPGVPTQDWRKLIAALHHARFGQSRHEHQSLAACLPTAALLLRTRHA